MRAFGFLSFGHYGHSPGSMARTSADMIRQAVEIGVGADALGVNGAYFRVHHFARQQAAPMPFLAAIAARTQRIEVGTGVIDMRYENPLYLAEEAAALDAIAQGRIALGISRGSPGTGAARLRGLRLHRLVRSTRRRSRARRPDLFLRAIKGEKVVDGDPHRSASRPAARRQHRARRTWSSASGGVRARAKPPSGSAARA